jgi:hypothetical protein
MTVYSGWLMIVLGVVLGIGGAVALSPVFGIGMLVALAGSGAFMVWLASGWDKPLDDSQDLYKYGRPANATVTAVGGEESRSDGMRTAKISLHVTPLNESDYDTTRVLALPGGEALTVGQRVTVKFDPNSRKNVVLLDESYEVEDGIAVARRNMQASLG